MRLLITVKIIYPKSGSCEQDKGRAGHRKRGKTRSIGDWISWISMTLALSNFTTWTILNICNSHIVEVELENPLLVLQVDKSPVLMNKNFWTVLFVFPLVKVKKKQGDVNTPCITTQFFMFYEHLLSRGWILQCLSFADAQSQMTGTQVQESMGNNPQMV